MTAQPKPAIPDIELDEEIGRGGMGVVYRGRQPYLDRKVAVKILFVKNTPKPQEFVERFRREAKILAGLSHAHIVACHQAGTTPSGDCYLAMEFIDGPNLRSWVEREGPLPERAALEVARDIACALEHAHGQGIIHRDVKPENVLLQKMERPPAGTAFPFVAKLVDLGLARPDHGSQDTRLTVEGSVMGTPSTMAPEQFDAPDDVDFRADIYGLGCVLYFALAGEAAFPERAITAIMMRKATGGAPDPAGVKPELAPGICSLVREMLAPRRENRLSSYEELIGRLDALIGDAAAVDRDGTKRRRRSGSDSVRTGAMPASTADEPTLVEPSSVPVPVPGLPKPAAILAIVAGVLVSTLVVWKVTGPRGGGGPGDRDDDVRLVATTPLMGAKHLKRLDGWERKRGGATWAGWEEGEGVTGHGTGSIPRLLGPAPWRVEGKILPLEAKEAGVRVDLADGSAVALRLQNLGSIALVSVVPFAGDGPEGAPRRGKPLASTKIEGLREGEAVPFAVVARRDRAAFEVGDKRLGPVPLDGRNPVGVSLFVIESSVRFEGLLVRRPER